MMTSPILVTGGTGRLGRHVVSGLRDVGRDVRVLSRRGGRPGDGVEHVSADLLEGEGVQRAIEGTEIIVHCAGGRKSDDVATRNLARAASRSGVRHLVYISVVGADRVRLVGGMDRMMFGYFGMKRAAELAVADSGLAWTTLRATQFHDAFLTLAQGMAKLPIIPVPAGLRFQPIDEREVAARLVELALGEPAGLVPEIGGPRIYGLGDLVRAYLHASGKRRLILPVPMLGQAARSIREGGNLAPERAVGHRTWEDYLVERLGSSGERRSAAA
jgi:uncharacterized protein YbjT (DUF2867 family)